MPEPDPNTSPLEAFFWPLHMLKAWSSFINVAPHIFAQPILPAWAVGNVYNITENNSNAPQTELEIVSRHSYGRQLGRISDALAVVVRRELQNDDLPASDRKRLTDFTRLAKSIDDIKAREALKRVERMAADLSNLKQTHRAAYDRAVELLEPMLRRG